MKLEKPQRMFNRVGIETSPDAPGVFTLSRRQRVIFIGSADRSIRRVLESHGRGDHGTATRNATSFWSESIDVGRRANREAELVEEYKREHNTNVPSENRPRISWTTCVRQKGPVGDVHEPQNNEPRSNRSHDVTASRSG